MSHPIEAPRAERQRIRFCVISIALLPREEQHFRNLRDFAQKIIAYDKAWNCNQQSQNSTLVRLWSVKSIANCCKYGKEVKNTSLYLPIPSAFLRCRTNTNRCHGIYHFLNRSSFVVTEILL